MSDLGMAEGKESVSTGEGRAYLRYCYLSTAKAERVRLEILWGMAKANLARLGS